MGDGGKYAFILQVIRYRTSLLRVAGNISISIVAFITRNCPAWSGALCNSVLFLMFQDQVKTILEKAKIRHLYFSNSIAELTGVLGEGQCCIESEGYAISCV